jgi:RNA polymerase sigma-70 factor (ECF subfamily)
MTTEHRPDDAPAADAVDRELVMRAKAGDYDAFEELVRRYQRRVYTLAYNMTGNKEDAEDMVQEVFVRAYRSLDGFKGDSSFFTWLYRIAVNRTINFLKKRGRKSGELSLNDMDQSVERDPIFVEMRARESPFRDVVLTELQKKLNAALQTLSEKHRSVVIMHDIMGMPHEEIARIMKCSVGTMRSRLFYARKRLQQELAEYAP